MSLVDNSVAMARLRDWQQDHAAALFDAKISNVGPRDVTIVCYFYRQSDMVYEHFPFLEFAIRQTWMWCGFMKTVLVTNDFHERIRSFQMSFPEWVTVQVEPELEPGDLNAMSVDCNSKLHTRFTTKYVLIVQDDGFPLRNGLEKFLRKYDFVGGALRRDIPIVSVVGRLVRHWPSNGGFSLRTNKICRLAAEYWRRYYAGRPFDVWQSEDMFYTDTLPREHLLFRWRVHVAESDIASRFSYDGSIPGNIRADVFGFHSARAFLELQKLGAVI